MNKPKEEEKEWCIACKGWREYNSLGLCVDCGADIGKERSTQPEDWENEFDKKWNSCNCNDGWDCGECVSGKEKGSGISHSKENIKSFIRQAISSASETARQSGVREVMDVVRETGSNNPLIGWKGATDYILSKFPKK